MGNVEYLDKEMFVKNRQTLKEADEFFSACIKRMFGTLDLFSINYMIENYDTSGDVSAGVSRFKEAKRRLGDLQDAMDTYLIEWEQAQENVKGQVTHIESGEEVYNGPVFSEIYEVEVEEGPAYELSPVYAVAINQNLFSSYFNDLTVFRNTKAYKDAVYDAGMTEVNNYELYVPEYGSTDYSDEMLRSALGKVLNGIPGELAIGKEDFVEPDWEKLEKQLGISGLADWASQVDGLLQLYARGDISESQIKKLQGLCVFLGTINNNYPAMNQFFLKLADKIGNGTYAIQGVDLIMESVFCMFSNYSQQIAYLDTMKESIIAVGYWSGSPLIDQIDEMRKLYDDKVLNFADTVFDAGKEITGEVIKETIIKSFPGLKDVDTGLDMLSAFGYMIGGTDRVLAAKELMGLYQYDQVLTETYENYAMLIREGIATEQDVEEAERLYNLLRSSKIQQYKAIKEITSEDTGLSSWTKEEQEWYKLACEKLEVLENEEYSDIK